MNIPAFSSSAVLQTSSARQSGLMFKSFVALILMSLTGVALAQPSPNIVLILSDDQSWVGTSVQMDPNGLGVLSASDFYETPNLEALASRGMRFRQAYSAAPNCSPTRASIQTGMSPASLNLTDIVGRGDLFTGTTDPFYIGNNLVAPQGASRLPTNVETIAQRIKNANPDYVTAHLGKWHLTGQSVQPSTPGGAVPHVNGDPGDYDYDLNDGSRGNNPIGSATDPKEMFSLTSRAIDFVENQAGQAGDESPFYLQISHYAVHSANQSLSSTKTKYDEKLANDPGVRHPGASGNTTYAGMTEDLDTTVGQLMSYLATTPDPRNPGHMLADNTYVFYTSDNGAVEASTNNLPLYSEKASTWEGGIRVPFIAAGPGIASNSVSNVPVISTDLYATITSLVGSTAPLPSRSESANLSGVLLNNGNLPSGVAALDRGYGSEGELFFHFPHYQHDKGMVPMSAMVDGTGQYKFVRIYGSAGAPDREYLFDLNRTISGPNDTWENIDTSDSRNLANDPAYAARMNTMRQQFDGWIQETDASLPYEVETPVGIQWRADDNARSVGLEGPDWRSVTDIDQRSREQLLRVETAGSITLVDAPSELAQLTSKAYHVDSGAGFRRTFFHVTEQDSTSPRLTKPADIDASASFEFWVRADSLSQGQVLLETGGATKGLAITLGDGDGDGAFDDVRLRAADSSAGRAIVTTAALDGVNITEDFVYLVAIIDQDVALGTQKAKIFINGEMASISANVLGGGAVKWDGTNEAGIAMVQGGFGGSGGPGAGNLGSAGFAGDIAEFGFFNYAMADAEIERRSQFDFGFVAGDIDQDGQLDEADIQILMQNWLANSSGSTSAVDRYSMGDLDNSGRVDLRDFRTMRQIVIDANQLQLLASLPEPGSMVLVSLGAIVAASAIRTRKRIGPA